MLDIASITSFLMLLPITRELQSMIMALNTQLRCCCHEATCREHTKILWQTLFLTFFPVAYYALRAHIVVLFITQRMFPVVSRANRTTEKSIIHRGKKQGRYIDSSKSTHNKSVIRVPRVGSVKSFSSLPHYPCSAIVLIRQETNAERH